MIKIIHIQTKKRKADQARCFLGSFFIFGVKCGFMLSWIHTPRSDPGKEDMDHMKNNHLLISINPIY